MVGLQLWKEVGDLKSWHLEEENLVKETGKVTALREYLNKVG